MNRILLQFAILVIMVAAGHGQQHMLPLWPDKVPNFRESGETEVSDTATAIRIKNVRNPG